MFARFPPTPTTVTAPGSLRMNRYVWALGRVARKPANANPGLKVNRSNNFSSTEMFFTAYVLCSLRLLKLKTEGQTK